nr:zinc finger, CCHC-type [Tanacetum cinerariifolium]
MIKELKSMFEKQAGVKRFDMIQTFHACKQEEGKSVSSYVLKMKGYVEQLERLGYVLPNYNMHNMEKTTCELHALLIECEKGLTKKTTTPQVMATQGGKIQKANKKSLNAKGKGKGKGKGKDKPVCIPKPKNLKPSAKEHPTKDDTCHHCKEATQRKRWVTISTSHLKTKYLLRDEDTSPAENTSKIPMEVENFEPLQYEVVPIRRSARTHRAPDHLCLNVKVEEYSLGDLNEPNNYKAAILDPESDNHSQRRKPLDGLDLGGRSEHLLTPKKSYNLNILLHSIYTLKPLLCFLSLVNIILHLFKISRQFTPASGQLLLELGFPRFYLNEDIYMLQPEGFVDSNHPKKVCKLQRSIYGLKQALRSYNKRFDEEIKRFGFAQNLDETCVYQKASESNVTFLILYVNDIIIIGNHIPSLQSVKSYLGKCFAMKDLGKASFILGIKIYRDRSKRLIGLSQSAYMDKILKRFRMDTSKVISPCKKYLT